MLRQFMWLACACCLLYPAALAQTPSQSPPCSEETHCDQQSYCDIDARLCRKCLNCESFKRKPPETPSTCIRSITECGSCVEGHDVRADCVPISSADDSSPFPYVWLAVVLGLVLLGLIIFIVIYAVRNLGTLKIRAFASASVQQPRQQFVATAPEFPPPYAPRAMSPQASDTARPPTAAYDSDSYMPQDDSIRPFIRRDSKVRVPGAVESDGNQEALPYGYPSYVRPPSYDYNEPSPPNEHLAETSSLDIRDSNGNAINISDPSSMSASGKQSVNRADARSLPTNRWRQQFQDSNNNGGGGSGGASPGASAPSLVINVVQSVSTLQQQNDVRL